MRRALERDPDYAIAHNNKGRCLLSLKRYAEAIPCLDQAILLDTDGYARFYYNRGWCLKDTEQYKKQSPIFRKH